MTPKIGGATDTKSCIFDVERRTNRASGDELHPFASRIQRKEVHPSLKLESHRGFFSSRLATKLITLVSAMTLENLAIALRAPNSAARMKRGPSPSRHCSRRFEVCRDAIIVQVQLRHDLNSVLSPDVHLFGRTETCVEYIIQRVHNRCVTVWLNKQREGGAVRRGDGAKLPANNIPR